MGPSRFHCSGFSPSCHSDLYGQCETHKPPAALCDTSHRHIMPQENFRNKSNFCDCPQPSCHVIYQWLIRNSQWHPCETRRSSQLGRNYYTRLSYRQGMVSQLTIPTFDLSMVQILTALCFGGTLCLVPRKQRGDPDTIVGIIESREITFRCATPSKYSSWYSSTILP